MSKNNISFTGKEAKWFPLCWNIDLLIFEYFYSPRPFPQGGVFHFCNDSTSLVTNLIAFVEQIDGSWVDLRDIPVTQVCAILGRGFTG